MNFQNIRIEDVIKIEPIIYYDTRGYLCESLKWDKYNEYFGNVKFEKELNISYSFDMIISQKLFDDKITKKRLITFIEGVFSLELYDIRFNSITYLNNEKIEINNEKITQIIIPNGVLYSLRVLSKSSLLNIKISYELDTNFDINSLESFFSTKT